MPWMPSANVDARSACDLGIWRTMRRMRIPIDNRSSGLRTTAVPDPESDASRSIQNPMNAVPRKRRRRRRMTSLNAEIRQSAKQIHAQGMAEAMRAATLMVCTKKLEEIRLILVANGFGNGPPLSRDSPSLAVSPLPSPPATSQQPPAVKNPCVHCGREGVYRTRPNQWNKVGSWYCRTHMVLAGQIEAEDRMDRVLPVAAAVATPEPVQPVVQPPQPSPGASTLADALGMATLEEG